MAIASGAFFCSLAVGWGCGEVDEAAVAADLAKLQRNRGLQSGSLADRVGPALAQVTGFSSARGVEARGSLLRQLLRAAEGLPPDLHLLFARACATRPDDKSTLTERLRIAANQIDRSIEVARRRTVEANRLVALRLLEDTQDDKGWFLQRLRINVDLRESKPVYHADYTLVVTAPVLSRITEQVSLPGDGTDVELGFAAGGAVRLDTVQRIHPQTWASQMTLDRTYTCGELIEYWSAVRLPDRSYAPPMSVMAPRRDCLHFSTTVHLGGLADQIWVLDGVPPPTVNDVTPSGRRLDVEENPQPTVEFQYLTPGLIYGLRWTWRDGCVR
ncbi:MAG: hypothetical protein ACK5MT_03575 [Actinomycetales bacterium]